MKHTNKVVKIEMAHSGKLQKPSYVTKGILTQNILQSVPNSHREHLHTIMAHKRAHRVRNHTNFGTCMALTCTAMPAPSHSLIV